MKSTDKETAAMKNAWHMGKEPPPFRMLICAMGAEQFDPQTQRNWLYFVGYYVPDEKAFYNPCEGTKYCSKYVDAWRIFDNTLEHLTMDMDCQHQRANH